MFIIVIKINYNVDKNSASKFIILAIIFLENQLQSKTIYVMKAGIEYVLTLGGGGKLREHGELGAEMNYIISKTSKK